MSETGKLPIGEKLDQAPEPPSGFKYIGLQQTDSITGPFKVLYVSYHGAYWAERNPEDAAQSLCHIAVEGAPQ